MTTTEPAPTLLPPANTAPPNLAHVSLAQRLARAPVIPIFFRSPCGVPRYYIADESLRALIVELFAYPTLTPRKRDVLESLGVAFRVVADPAAKPARKAGRGAAKETTAATQEPAGTSAE